jgi:hypothetical protein
VITIIEIRSQRLEGFEEPGVEPVFLRTIRQSNYAILTNFCIFPRNVAPDFLQYLSEDPNQKEKGRETMKWLQLAYSIISVNAAILALLAVIMNLLRRSKSRNDN